MMIEKTRRTHFVPIAFVDMEVVCLKTWASLLLMGSGNLKVALSWSWMLIHWK
jgi:hypothetical protein